MGDVENSEETIQEIQEETDSITSDTFGDYLPVEEINTEVLQSEIIYNIETEIDLSSIQTLIEVSNSNQTLILEKLDFLTSVTYFVIISIIFHFAFRFFWGIFGADRF